MWNPIFACSTVLPARCLHNVAGGVDQPLPRLRLLASRCQRSDGREVTVRLRPRPYVVDYERECGIDRHHRGRCRARRRAGDGITLDRRLAASGGRARQPCGATHGPLGGTDRGRWPIPPARSARTRGRRLAGLGQSDCPLRVRVAAVIGLRGRVGLRIAGLPGRLIGVLVRLPGGAQCGRMKSVLADY